MENKFICTYPGCKKEGLCEQTFELINEENTSVELLFCKYHFLIVMGGHFKARSIKAEQNLLGESKACGFELIGPLNEVEIVEQVMGAIEMIKKLKSDNKGLKS